MSLLHPEELRECRIDGHRWLAERWNRIESIPPIIGQGFGARAQALHRDAVHRQRLGLYERWVRCPKCGSKKVKTIKAAEAKAWKAVQRSQPSATPTLPPSPPPTQPPPSYPAGGPIAELERIAALFRDGLLTEVEFVEMKRRLISSDPSPRAGPEA